MDLRRLGIVAAMVIAPCTMLAQRTGGRTPTRVAEPSAVGRTRAATPAGGRRRGARPLPRRRVGILAVTPRVEADEPEADAPAIAPAAAPSPVSGPSSIQPPLPPTAPPGASHASGRGSLWLAVEPKTAQVYVDGFFVGTVEESQRAPTGLSLAPGWHRLELRAPGCATPAVNVTIEPGRMARYENELKKLP